MLPLLAPILTQLASEGLQKVADAVMDKGVDYVEDKLGITLTPDETGKLPPEKLEAVKNEANRHQEFMAELELKDREGARANHLAIATSKDVIMLEKYVMPLLALGTVAAAFILITILMFVNVEDNQEQIIIFALGFVTGAAGQVLSFYFGSSQGSKEKTAELKELTK